MQRQFREHWYLRWDVVYRPGVLKAVGIFRTRNAPAPAAPGRGLAPRVPWGGECGTAEVECVRETAGAPAALRIRCEETALRADRTGLAHAAVTVVDERGRFAPRANPEVAVEVSGPARLIGLENGDPLDTTNYRATRRRAFNGLLLAVVQAGEEAGLVTVTARAEGLAPARAEIAASSGGVLPRGDRLN